MNTSKGQLTAKDLALYLGCEIALHRDVFRPDDFSVADHLNMMAVHQSVEEVFVQGDELASMNVPVDLVKPILRPLSDMTDEEALQVAKEKYPSPDRAYWHKEWGEIAVCKGDLVSEMKIEDIGQYGFKHLLSRHIDLFNWIGDDLVIDATTLSPNPYQE